MIIINSMVCISCDEEKPVSEFYKKKSSPTGYQRDCKPCNLKRCAVWSKLNPEARKASSRKSFLKRDKSTIARKQREWRKANPTRVRAYVIKHKYGLSDAAFKKMRIEQGDRCAICRAQAPLFVDHCHVGFEVRGLLCRHCNSGLGFFRDDEGSLVLAIQYLKDWRAEKAARRDGTR